MFGNNRKQRLELFKGIRQAAHSTRTARLSWNIQESREGADKTVTASTAGFEAVTMVRELLSQYSWPTNPKLFYTGMRRTSVRLDQDEVEAGVITVTGEMRTPIGAHVQFDIPVEIRAGRLLEPSIMIFNGSPRVISQSTIDGTIRDNNTYSDTQPRSIYGAPFDRYEQAARKPFHQERRSPGMFAVAGKQAALREFIRTKGMKGVAQLQEQAEVGEWELPGHVPTPGAVPPIPLTNPRRGPSTGPGIVEPTSHTGPKTLIPSSPMRATGPQMGPGACATCGGPVEPMKAGKFGPNWCGPECFQKSQSKPRMPMGDEPPPKNVGRPVKGLPKGDEPPGKIRSKGSKPEEYDRARERQMDEEYERDEQEPSLDETWQGEQESMERESSKPSRSKPSTSKSKHSTSKASKTAHMRAEESKVVRYETSKNPEPNPTNPAYGEDVDDAEGNVEEDLERKQRFMPGQKVSLKKKLSAPTRGGGRTILNSGKKGIVIRDQAGDGYAVYVKFDDGQYALVPGQYL